MIGDPEAVQRNTKLSGSWSRITKIGFRNWFDRELVRNALSLYGIQIANYVVPLITIPYLARVLGISGWGLVAFAQAFGTYVVLVGEYAFAYSATREVARNRENREKLARILGGVLGAKGLLIVVASVLAFVSSRWIPLLWTHRSLFWWVIFWAAFQAANMRWFFQGLERMRFLARIEISTRVLTLIGILVFVRGSGDEWRVFAIQGFCSFGCFLVCALQAYRGLPLCWPTSVSVREALRIGRSLFLFEASVSLYTIANTFILGLLVSPELVGFYAGAEKIARAGLRLLDPLTQTLYPRLSHLAWRAPERAARLARVGAIVTVGGGAAMGTFVFFLAPELVRMLLGAGYSPAVPILRILALLPLFAGLSIALGNQWALPLGLERPVNVVTLVAGLLNIGLAVWLARLFAGLGMACIAVFTEALIASGIYIVLRLRRVNHLVKEMGRVEQL